MSDLVGNPEDRFSRVAAQLTKFAFLESVEEGKQPQKYFCDYLNERNVPFIKTDLLQYTTD